MEGRERGRGRVENILSNLPKWRGLQIAGSSPAYWSLEWENENTGIKMGYHHGTGHTYCQTC